MKSSRFNTPVTQSGPLDQVENNEVLFDKSNGHIMYKGDELSWSLTDEGHSMTRHNVQTMTGNGLLTYTADNSTVGVVCYGPTEYPTKIVYGHGERVDETYVRVQVGIQQQKSIVFTEDKRIFIVDGRCESIPVDNELNITEFMRAKQLMSNIDTKIGDISKLKSTQLTFVGAMNDLIDRVNCPRHMVGYGEFLVLKDEDFTNFSPKDLDICFNYQHKRWMYYSEALGDWVYLPKGWEKLTHITRFAPNIQYKPAEELEVGETVGIIETELCYQWTGEVWDEIPSPYAEVGDEYLIQFALIGNEPKSVTVLYTKRGWVHTI